MTTEQLQYISEQMRVCERSISDNTGLTVRINIQIMPEIKPLEMDVANLLESMAASVGLTIEQLRHKCRKQEFVSARQACVLLLDHYLKMSSTRMGKLLHQDHSSVLHALKVAKDRLVIKDVLFMGIYQKIDATAQEWLNNYNKGIYGKV